MGFGGVETVLLGVVRGGKGKTLALSCSEWLDCGGKDAGERTENSGLVHRIYKVVHSQSELLFQGI